MTDNKKSALEKLRDLYPAQLLKEDGTVQCELGPSAIVSAILELAERVEQLELNTEYDRAYNKYVAPDTTNEIELPDNFKIMTDENGGTWLVDTTKAERVKRRGK